MKFKAKFGPRRDNTYGKVFGYQIDENGEVEVDDEHVEAMINTGNFEQIGGKKAPAKGKDVPEEMLIMRGNDEQIDLMKLEKPALQELAIEIGLKIDARSGEQKIREAIMEFISE